MYWTTYWPECFLLVAFSCTILWHILFSTYTELVHPHIPSSAFALYPREANFASCIYTTLTFHLLVQIQLTGNTKRQKAGKKWSWNLSFPNFPLQSSWELGCLSCSPSVNQESWLLQNSPLQLSLWSSSNTLSSLWLPLNPSTVPSTLTCGVFIPYSKPSKLSLDSNFLKVSNYV